MLRQSSSLRLAAKTPATMDPPQTLETCVSLPMPTDAYEKPEGRPSAAKEKDDGGGQKCDHQCAQAAP
jgi:hypothetical protein